MSDEKPPAQPTDEELLEQIKADPAHGLKAVRDSMRYAREAATNRVKFKNYQDEVEPKLAMWNDPAALAARLAELKGGGGKQKEDAAGAPPSPAAAPPPAAPAPVEEEDPAVLAELEADEVRLLESLLDDAGAFDASDARTLLMARKQLDFDDDGSPILIVGGKPELLSSASLAKVLNPALLRSKGAAGSGQAPFGFGTPVDMQRAQVDPDYFAANRSAVLDQLRAKERK